MRGERYYVPFQYPFVLLLCFCAVMILATACSTGGGTTTSGNKTRPLAARQVLVFPNVGTADLGTLDPALEPDQNSLQAVNMIYSGLVASDRNLNVIPDQAVWQTSEGGRIYTFTLKPTVSFSDGTPVTAQDYVYSWTRALLPEINSPIASLFEGPIVGANDVSTGKTRQLRGVKALDNHTLQVTLTRPTPYFLQALTNPLFFPLNHRVIDRYGQRNWTQHVADAAVGTGPFMVKEWEHNVRMVFAPNPFYYGAKTRLTEVDMLFVKDQMTAYKAYQAGQYSFVWNLSSSDQQSAKGTQGFTRIPVLQTDSLFFDNSKPPFNNLAVRQAFAYAIDKQNLIHNVFNDTVAVANTIIPPGMPGYQGNYQGIPYDKEKAKSLLESVYPDISKFPQVTFSYPNSQVSPEEAAALQHMWQSALGIQVNLQSVELNAYNDETSKHQVQLGFVQWTADFADPYDWLTLNLYSRAGANSGQWKDPTFDDLVTRAETLSGDDRIMLYNQAEQIAITRVGWLPLDHETQAAIIPPWVQGVALNGFGLYFGDWSGISLLQH